MEKYCRAGQAADNNKIWHMRIVCWMTKATDTHSEYVILIAFPRRHWLREHASVLYTYTASLVLSSKSDGVDEDEYGASL